MEVAGLRGPASLNHSLSSDFNLSRHVRTHPRSVARLHPLSLPSSNFFVFTHLINGRAVCCKVLERYRQHPISNFTNGDSPIGYFSAVFAPEDSAFFGEFGNLGGVLSGVPPCDTFNSHCPFSLPLNVQ